MTATIIDPTVLTAPASSPVPASAPRPASLDGLRVGLLENTKHNAAEILAAVGDELAAHHDVALVPLTKRAFAMPLPDDLVAELVAECDVVVLGVGDCGSCSASAVADAIALERIGIPAAVVCTEAFVGPSQAMADLKGAPDYPFLLTPHPIANLDASGTVDRGRGLAERIAARLVDARELVGASS